MIVKILEECNRNISKAAIKLGLSRKGLQLKMIKYNLRKKRHEISHITAKYLVNKLLLLKASTNKQ